MSQKEAIMSVVEQIRINDDKISVALEEVKRLKQETFDLHCILFTLRTDIKVGDDVFFQGEPVRVVGFDKKYGLRVVIKRYNKNGNLSRREIFVLGYQQSELTKTKEEYKRPNKNKIKL